MHIGAVVVRRASAGHHQLWRSRGQRSRSRSRSHEAEI